MSLEEFRDEETGSEEPPGHPSLSASTALRKGGSRHVRHVPARLLRGIGALPFSWM